MKTNGTLISIELNGKPIGTIQEWEIEPIDIPFVDIEGELEITFYYEARDYFMKALMYALTFKN